ncbi:hypothetical protein AURANDRAFT_68951, partial [Aureococcus anophagefferens]
QKRAKHHLGQLLLGLDYAYEEGRLAALDALAAALRALPPATVDEHGASFFAQLAMRCGNEASAACAARVKDVLATLLGRVAPETRAGLLQRCLDFLDAAGSEDRAAEFDAAEKLAFGPPAKLGAPNQRARARPEVAAANRHWMGREPECATVKPCTDNVAPDSQTSSGPAMVGLGGSDDGASCGTGWLLGCF